MLRQGDRWISGISYLVFQTGIKIGGMKQKGKNSWG